MSSKSTSWGCLSGRQRPCTFTSLRNSMETTLYIYIFRLTTISQFYNRKVLGFWFFWSFFTITGFPSCRAQDTVCYPWPQYQQKVLMKPKPEAGLNFGGSLAPSCTLYTTTSRCNKGTYQMLLHHSPLLQQGGCTSQTRLDTLETKAIIHHRDKLLPVPWATAKHS